jgi:hypothetical protein
MSAVSLIWTGAKRQLGTTTQLEQPFILTGPTDQLTAELAVIANSPPFTTFSNGAQLPLTQVDLDVLSPGQWKGSATWGKDDNAIKQVPTIQFDTDGGTSKITQSLATLNSYTASGTAPNHKGAIGVTKDNVEGTEITQPAFKFTEKHYLPISVATSAPYLKTLAGLTGSINQGPWRTFDDGQVLFLGCSGGGQIGTIWEVTFKFSAQPDANGLTIGDITGIDKPAWACLWVSYQESTDQNSLVKKPFAVYVERVYPYANFDLLGIGGGSVLTGPQSLLPPPPDLPPIPSF